jgi:hypothetical protein
MTIVDELGLSDNAGRSKYENGVLTGPYPVKSWDGNVQWSLSELSAFTSPTGVHDAVRKEISELAPLSDGCDRLLDANDVKPPD